MTYMIKKITTEKIGDRWENTEHILARNVPPDWLFRFLDDVYAGLKADLMDAHELPVRQEYGITVVPEKKGD